MKKNNVFGNFQLTNNLPLKLISLVFAVLLWIFVMDTENPIIEREITGLDILYLNDEVLQSKNLDISNYSVDTLSAVVLGKRDKVLKLDRSSIVVNVDIKTASAGTQSFKINVKSTDPEIFIKSISDHTIELSFDTIDKRNFVLTRLDTGKMPENRVLHSIMQEIDEIELRGPKRHLDSVDRVFAALDLSLLETSNEIFSPILIVDKNGREISEVNAAYNLQKFDCKVYKNASIPITYKLVGEINPKFAIKEIQISPKNLEVYGEVAEVEKLEQAKNQFIIDANIINGNLSQEFSSPNLTKDMQIKQVPRLNLKVDEFAEKTFVINQDNIEFADLNKDYTIRFLSDFSTSIKVYGEKNILEQLQASEFKVNVSLKNLSIGEYKLKGRLSNFNFNTVKFIHSDLSMTDHLFLEGIAVKISKKESDVPKPKE